MKRPYLILLMLTLALALVPVAARAQSNSGLGAALQWLVQHQNSDGSFGSPPSASVTAQALVALATPWEGVDASDATERALAYIRGNWDKIATDAGTLGYLSMALRALGRSVSDGLGAGHDVVAALKATYNVATGMYGSYLYQHGIAVLGMAAAGQPVPPEAVQRILDSQAPNGGWAWNGSVQDADSDTNTTSIMVQALVAAGRGNDAAISRAMAFLARHAAERGGYGYQQFPGSPLEADSNSTALVLQALLAADQDPNDPTWKDPVGALLTFQNASGAFRWTDASPDDNLLSTVQAIPAAAQRFLPFSASDASGKRTRVEASRRLSTAATGPERLFFPETGHTLAYGFKAFWEQNGGLKVFGYPLTEEFDEYDAAGQKRTVQYFERARFEYYPELRGTPFEIQLGLIGREVRRLGGISFATAALQDGTRSSGATSSGLQAPFNSFWTGHDGLVVFGYPISEAHYEYDAVVGREIQVQWFERARMEWHEDAPADWQIELSQLGRLLLYGRR